MKYFISVSIVLCSFTSAAAQGLPAWRHVIPAAASVRGNQGSDWHTDVVIHNRSPDSVTVTLELLGPSPSGPTGVVLPESLGPGQTLVLTDTVATLFPEHSIGALVVTTRDTSGIGVPVVVTSRTWTQGPAPSGTYGQGIPAVAWEEDYSLSGLEKILTPLETSEAFRTNIGLVNLSTLVPGVFAIDILDAAGETLATHWLELPGERWIQLNNLPDFLGLQGSDMTATVRLVNWHNDSPWAPPGFNPAPEWIAYGSMVDNRTNDPTFIEALPETTKWGITRQRIVPAAANTEGAAGSFWVTDLVAHHAGETVPTFLQVDVVPTDDTPFGSPKSFTIPIWPHQTLAVNDILGEHFPSHEVAALVVKGWNGGANFTDLKVTSRTWTASGEGDGTYGQAISGLPRRYGSDPISVPGLTESALFRSNLGIVNPSTNLRETFTIEIFDAAGQSRGVVTRTLEPMSHTQINGILQSLGLEGAGFTAVVNLQSSENLYIRRTDPWDPIFTAYGSIVDNATNDPTFVTGTPLPPPDDPDAGAWVDFDEDEPWYRCPDTEIPFQATFVRTFNQAYHYFGAENHRTIVEEVEFPDGGDWNQIGLRIHLECPESGDCDDWDRTGSLQIVLNPEASEEDWEYLELARYITPYHLEMCEYIDITALGPLLSGPQTLVSWIDTWVGPGHASGEGWRITYDFVFYPGIPRTPVEVRNVWGRRTVTVGDPGNPIDDQVDPVALEVPADVTRVEARLITTGHYFGVTENCAEFCVLRQDIYVDDQPLSVLPWRTDCEYNPHSPQAGTWTYDRNGWCPGAVVVGNTVDLTDRVTPGETSMIDFDIRRQDGTVYENTVDGSPFEWVSMQVFLYR
ncbi:MAG: peptide-N-glycosidase F-related protein [Acidobacteriota bacterium]